LAVQAGDLKKISDVLKDLLSVSVGFQIGEPLAFPTKPFATSVGVIAKASLRYPHLAL
jgi:hypothetical protein